MNTYDKVSVEEYYNNPKLVFVEPGKVYRKPMPASEVMMHMNIVDHVYDFKLIEGQHMVQLLKDGENFSIPVTTGEVGLYYDSKFEAWYYVEE